MCHAFARHKPLSSGLFSTNKRSLMNRKTNRDAREMSSECEKETNVGLLNGVILALDGATQCRFQLPIRFYGSKTST